MINQSTALIAVNNNLLFNNQNLFQGLFHLGIQVKNNASINTKESFLIEVERYKPRFALLSSNIAGVISIDEVLTKLSVVSSNTKLVLFVGENDKGKIQNYIQLNTMAIIWNENIKDTLDVAIKQLIRGQSFLCGKCIEDLRYQLITQKSEGKTDRALLSLLTTREMEVLHALTKGTNYKQISKQLFISESTVKTHVNNIFTKLNVNDRTQAVLYALNHGIDSLIKKPSILLDAINQNANVEIL